VSGTHESVLGTCQGGSQGNSQNQTETKTLVATQVGGRLKIFQEGGKLAKDFDVQSGFVSEKFVGILRGLYRGAEEACSERRNNGDVRRRHNRCPRIQHVLDAREISRHPGGDTDR
jgi:hypothetical protein